MSMMTRLRPMLHSSPVYTISGSHNPRTIFSDNISPFTPIPAKMTRLHPLLIHDPSSISLVITTRLHYIRLSWPVYTISGNHDPHTLSPIISSSFHLFRQSTPVNTLFTYSVVAHCLRCFAKPLLTLNHLWARRGKGKIGNYWLEPLISTKNGLNRKYIR